MSLDLPALLLPTIYLPRHVLYPYVFFPMYVLCCLSIYSSLRLFLHVLGQHVCLPVFVLICWQYIRCWAIMTVPPGRCLELSGCNVAGKLLYESTACNE
ncbi:hypothetical protein FKM82_011822 [Ascaphus truei]